MISLFIDFTQAAETVEKVLLWVVAILVVFDIYLYLNKTPGDTISNILRDWVYKKRLVFITYFWGVLAGHFFLGDENPPFNNNYISLGIVLSIALILYLLTVVSKQYKPKPIHQTALFILGAAVGHFFWSLKS